MPVTAAELIPAAAKASGFTITEVVCGRARGADTFGAIWAAKQGIPVADFPAEWKKYGRAAGPVRNKEMAIYGEALIVFIWQNSRGSQNMLDTMRNLGKPCFVVRDGIIPATL